MDDKILTAEGKKKLEEELAYLENTKRKEVSERIKEARSFGDLSENSEYDDAKNEQAYVEKRISEIHETLLNSRIVRQVKKKSGEITIGSIVVVEMAKKQREFKIVGAAESDISQGKISNSSPVGVALLGHVAGDVVKTKGPTGKNIKITVLSVK